MIPQSRRHNIKIAEQVHLLYRDIFSAYPYRFFFLAVGKAVYYELLFKRYVKEHLTVSGYKILRALKHYPHSFEHVKVQSPVAPCIDNALNSRGSYSGNSYKLIV